MKRVQAKVGFPPRRIGIIGGSGLYQIEGLTKQKWERVNTPFGPPSDQLLTGEIAGRGVVFLPRHGRNHHLLPSELNHRANIWAMKKLGVGWIISVSAVGSLQSRYRPRDIVFVNQFVDRTKKSAEHTFFGRGIVAHVAFAHPVCDELRQTLMRSARALKARIHDSGSYVNMEGPAFSTQAESILNHKAGHAVIGMTNLPATCSSMMTKERIRDACGILCRKYAEQYPVLHGNLSRFTGLLIMLNVTLFFINGAVIYEGYYYTFYSLGLLAAVEVLLIIPHGLFDRLWFYALTLLAESIGLYFLTSSIWHWIATHRS